jgi:hypothetical protein
MSVKLKWFYEVMESDTMSEEGKLRAARLLHMIEFPEDVETPEDPVEE